MWPEAYVMGESLSVSMAREGMLRVNAICLLNECGFRTSSCLVSYISLYFNYGLLLGMLNIWAG